METPFPNDSLKAFLSPPVGRLRSFRRDWQREKCSNNILNIITNGYVQPFITKPRLARVRLIHSGYNCHQKPTVLVEPNPINRMVTASAGVRTDLSKVVHSSCRSICHSSEPQNSIVRISSPRPKSLGHRCSEHKLVGSPWLCLPSHRSPSQGDPKNQSSCLTILIAPGWPGMPWFWCRSQQRSHSSYQCQQHFSNSPTTKCFTTIHNISTSMPGV